MKKIDRERSSVRHWHTKKKRDVPCLRDWQRDIASVKHWTRKRERERG